MKLLFVILGLLAVVAMGYAMKECTKVEHAPVSKKMLKHTRFYIPFHSDCLNCQKDDQKWSSITGRSQPHKLCYNMTGKDAEGMPFEAKFKCKYNAPGIGDCELKTKKKPYLAGEVILTKTDNSTYMAGATCIYGKENFWWVASITESIREDLRQEILDDFKARNFPTGKTVRSGSKELVFEHLTLINEDDEDIC